MTASRNPIYSPIHDTELITAEENNWLLHKLTDGLTIFVLKNKAGTQLLSFHLMSQLNRVKQRVTSSETLFKELIPQMRLYLNFSF